MVINQFPLPATYESVLNRLYGTQRNRTMFLTRQETVIIDVEKCVSLLKRCDAKVDLEALWTHVVDLREKLLRSYRCNQLFL